MANADVELGDVNLIRDTIQSVLSCVENGRNLTNKFSPSIYMAPSTLRDLSPSSFNPRVVSIGPLHREDENLQAFEEQKAIFVHYLFQRLKSPLDKTLEACVRKVVASINQIKACYDGKQTYSDTELAKMMVIDSCFILEFVHRMDDGFFSMDDTLSSIKLRDQHTFLRMDGSITLRDHQIPYDLVLLENQIPFFVLDDIFHCTILQIESGVSLTEYIHPILKFLNLFQANIKIRTLIDTDHDHILGLLYQCYKPKANISSYFSSSTIHSAVELDRAGVNFKPNRDEKWPLAIEINMCRFACFPWSWGKPTLRLPALRINHFTELVLRNLIAYEQSSPVRPYVTSYAMAMDMLVDTQEDIAKLVESKVLVNHIGSHEEAANMINNICKEVVWVNFFYSQQWQKLDTHCNNYWPRKIAWLRRTYFSSPWNVIALLAGIILFSLAVVQTIYAIKPS